MTCLFTKNQEKQYTQTDRQRRERERGRKRQITHKGIKNQKKNEIRVKKGGNILNNGKK